MSWTGKKFIMILFPGWANIADAVDNQITTLLIIVLFIIAGFILFYIAKKNFQKDLPVTETINKPPSQKMPCILCGSQLYKGENIKSEEFKGEKESIVHIYGCPNCYGKNAQSPRKCPICKKAMPDDGYLMGRMWKRKNGKLHLHVSGCTVCRKNV